MADFNDSFNFTNPLSQFAGSGCVKQNTYTVNFKIIRDSNCCVYTPSDPSTAITITSIVAVPANCNAVGIPNVASLNALINQSTGNIPIPVTVAPCNTDEPPCVDCSQPGNFVIDGIVCGKTFRLTINIPGIVQISCS